MRQLISLYSDVNIPKQNPNATSNTLLNNSKPTECRLIPLKPWLDKCVCYSIFGIERSAWFHAHAFAFCLMVPAFEKVTKLKAEHNLFQCCFSLRKWFVFVICRHFTTLKWLKVLKLSKICLKVAKVMTPKTIDQNILFLIEHCRFNECGIKLLILISNYLWTNLVSTRRYARHKMSVDDSSRKLDRTCIYRAQLCTSLAKENEQKSEKCSKHHIFTKRPHSSICFLTYPNNFMFFLWDTH